MEVISWNNTSGLLALIYILIMFTLIVLHYTLPTSSTTMDESENLSKSKVAAFYVKKLTYPRQNCADQVRLCGTDNDCISGCFRPNEFVCHEQYCEQRSALNGGGGGGGEESATQLKCNTEKGIVLVLHSDGKFRCTSLYSQYFDSTGKKNDYVCQQGVLQWDESTGTFECKCNTDMIRVAHTSTPFIPRCYPANVLNLAEFRKI